MENMWGFCLALSQLCSMEIPIRDVLVVIGLPAVPRKSCYQIHICVCVLFSIILNCFEPIGQ